MTNVKHLPNAIRFALFAGASVASVGGSAFAQEQEAKTLDRVEVVGSRIKRVDTETTSPVTSLSRADIERTGLTNVRDILNRITASDGNGLSTVSTQTNGNDGAESLSLRNLGPQRTLILVDGHRWATGVGGTVDLTTIPAGIVERIDVLKDGASATYGSDAIGGVVNIITRKDFEGIQFRAQYGETEKGDGAKEAYDLTFGASSERTKVMMNIGFVGRDGIGFGDRKISRVPVFGCPEPATPTQPSNCGSSFNAGGRFFVPGLAGAGVTLIPGRPGTAASDFRAFNNGDRFNFSPVNFLQLPGDQSNLFASATHEITDNLRAVARFNYTKRTSDNQIAQVPVGLDDDGAFFGNGPQWNIPIAADNVFNPFGTEIRGAGFRMISAGGRFNHADQDTFTTQVGLEGAFNIGERGFNWDVGLQYNDNQNDERQDNLVNLFALKQALGPSFRDATGLHCGTPGAVIAACTPFNIFGGPDLGVAAGVISAAEAQKAVQFVTHTANSQTGNTTNNYYANLSGDLFTLPGGMAQFAAGYEYRKDAGFNQPDSFIVGGGSSTNFTEPTQGQTILKEFYTELSLPLLSDVFLAKELELTLKSRTSKFESQGRVGANFSSDKLSSKTNYGVAARWKPFDDLLVRASWGETFRAPSTNDLFGGGAEGFPDANDPCNNQSIGLLTAAQQARCVALGVPAGGWNQTNTQQRALFGGNPGLIPEHGENITTGFVYNPSWLSGFDVSVDYWRIRIADAIVTFGADQILNDCITGNGGAGNAGLCGFITRNAAGAITELRAVSFNAATIKTDGVDFAMHYRFDTNRFGRFGFASETTWVSRDRNRVSANDALEDFVGRSTGTNPTGGTTSFEYRSNFVTTWAMADFDASWTMRYTSDLVENCQTNPAQRQICNTPGRVTATEPNGTNHVGAVTYHDIQAGWNAPWKAHISVGVNNLFSKEPPLSTRAFAASFLGGVHDLPSSQFWYVQYRQDF